MLWTTGIASAKLLSRNVLDMSQEHSGDLSGWSDTSEGVGDW